MFDTRPAPPKNVEAEQELLANLFHAPKMLDAIRDRIRPEFFAEPVHGIIYEALCGASDAGAIPTPPVINQRTGGQHQKYIATLFKDVAVVPSNVPHCAGLIIECWQRREALDVLREAEATLAVIDPDKPAPAVLEETEQRLHEIGESRGGAERGPVSAAQAMREGIALVERAWRNKGRLAGVTTGLSDLDHALGGLLRGELTILAGRPGMGKTTMAKTTALAAAESGEAVMVFSKEMPREMVGIWLLADLSGISAEKLRRGEVSNGDFDLLNDAARRVDAATFEIDDSPALTMGMIRARCRRFKRRHKRLGLVVIDHLGLVHGSKDARRQGRVAEITEITNALKVLAKELQCPVLALSQLNRAVEGRDDKRPGLADLRDSGSIEQDADVVILCYREEYYRRQEEPQRKPGEKDDKYDSRLNDWRRAMIDCKGIAELIVAKNRSGAQTTVRAKFNPERSRMENLARWS